MIANRRKNYSRLKRTPTLLVIVVVVLFVLSLSSFTNYDVANAVSPQSYVEKVENNELDWYMQSKFLNLPKLKEVVGAWFVNAKYDFTEVENDPVLVAVIDTGIDYRHELFSGKYDESGAPISSDTVGKYDVLARDADGNIMGKNTVLPEDKDYTGKDQLMDDANDKHGTHVSGIIATLIHELGLEKYIKILPIKAAYPALKGSIVDVEALKSGVQFAFDCGADVVNMSISSDNPKYGAQCITEDTASRMVFVAAAGNYGQSSAIKKYYPASNENVIGVMNCTYDSEGNPILASKSNYGTTYDICAPGSSIYSANGGTLRDYKPLSGTSMATPFVSFAAALATLRYRALGSKRITQTEIANIVRNSTTGVIKKDNLQFKLLDICNLAESDEFANVEINVLSGSVKQTVGEVSTISLKALTYPRENIGTIKWYVDGEFVLQSDNFEYIPQDVAGDREIKAVWSYGREDRYIERSATLTVSVVYRALDADDIKALNVCAVEVNGADNYGDSYRSGSVIRLGFENMPTHTIDPDTVVIWFVNGEFYATGREFEFVPDQIGKYTIQAKINGIYTKETVISVDKISEEDLNILRTMTISIVTTIAVVLLIATVIIFVRKKKTSRKT